MSGVLVRVLVLAAFAAVLPHARAAGAPPASDGDDGPLQNLPRPPAFDLSSMDRSADPCQDFYRYACGGWQARNPIPADQPGWDVSSKMSENNRRLLWGILQRLADPAQARSEDQRRIGDAFAACMDPQRADAASAAALAPLFDRIEALDDRRQLPPLLAQLQLASGPGAALFGFSSAPDYGDASRMIAFATPGGLGLPDRDYYFRRDAHARALRAAYALHVEHMFVLLGDAPGLARQEAARVVAQETALARATATLVQMREPERLHHVFGLDGLRSLTPAFDWRAYLAALGVAPPERINVTEPGFFRAVDVLLRGRPVRELRPYLRWHLVHALAPWLSGAMAEEDFDFFHRRLEGVPAQPARWKRCVDLVDTQVGEALGQEFVRVAFSPELKESTRTMTRQIEEAMGARIRSLDWMSPATKARAIDKLHAIVNNVGYPDRWRDYSALEIRRDDLAGNVMRGNAFEMQRLLRRIGQPTDRGDWEMTPQTVNAYYEPQLNTINFPAGILQPPLFDARSDDAPNYGDTGATIGHELTHGFDDEGRHFDGAGTLRDWWTARDAVEFGRRSQCLVRQYGGYAVVDELHIDGRLTLGENIADLGGLVLSYAAWQQQRALRPGPAEIDGFTPEQRFFIGGAQWACSNERPERLRLLVATDPHSPPRFRVNGLVANFAPFQQAFHCRTGQPMAPAARCSVW